MAGSPIATSGLRGAAVCLAVLIGSTTLSQDASADFIGPIVTVEATTDRGTARFESPLVVDLPPQASDVARFKLAENRPLIVPGVGVVGEIEDLELFLDGDPVVDLAFAVSAGNFPTTFTITSAMVGFPGITNPIAFASAGVTLTDGDPLPGDGASMGLVAPRTGLYKAEYNGGTTFAELIGAQSLLSAGTTSASADSGVQTISDTVSSIQASFSFQLSADDMASGTSHFEVVIPEPASVSIIVIAGAVAAMSTRRRRTAVTVS